MFSTNLTKLREAKGLTRGELGRMLGFPNPTARQVLHRWESGEYEPKLTNLIKLSEALDCTLDDLVK